MMPNKDPYLRPSPHADDAGHLVGRDPRELPVELLRQLGGPESPIKAIRAKCLDCCGNQPGEVAKCAAVFCALWPHRMSVNTFHASRTVPENSAAHLDGFQPANGIPEGEEA